MNTNRFSIDNTVGTQLNSDDKQEWQILRQFSVEIGDILNKKPHFNEFQPEQIHFCLDYR